MSARSVGSGTISFGLVSVPFKLHTAQSAKSASFNMLHKTCGSRLAEQYICDVENVVVERSDIVRGAPVALEKGGFRLLHKGCGAPLKQQLICRVENVVVERSDTMRGFEHTRDQYVTFTDEELKSLEAARTGVLELQEFVPASTVDQILIAKSYFIGPDKGGDRAYRLLSDALERNGKVAVGRLAQRGKDKLVIVRPYRKGLVLQECFYADEVRSFDDIDSGGTFDFKPLERALADKLIEQLEKDSFEPSRFRDEWLDKIMAAVCAKVAGEEITAAPEVPKAQIIDLLEALKRSVAAADASAANSTLPSEIDDDPLSAPPPRPKGRGRARRRHRPRIGQ